MRNRQKDANWSGLGETQNCTDSFFDVYISFRSSDKLRYVYKNKNKNTMACEKL